MKVNDLEDGQVVSARWGSAGKEAPDWGPWVQVRLAVQRAKGKVVLVTLKDFGWVEASEQDLCDPDEGSKNAYFLVEDQYLEIEGLTR